MLRVRVFRVGVRDLDHAGAQQQLDLGHRGRQSLPLLRAQRLKQQLGKLVAAPVQRPPFGDAVAGQPGDPYPPVRLRRVDRDKPRGLQRPQKTTQVAGIQAKAGSQRTDVLARRPDSPQQPRLAERAIPPEEPILKGPHPLSDRPIERTHPCHQLRIHSLTLVRYFAGYRGAYERKEDLVDDVDEGFFGDGVTGQQHFVAEEIRRQGDDAYG